MESAKQIELHAAAWLARRDRGEWTDADQLQLQSWLDEAAAHRIAFLRLESVWAESQRLTAFAAGLPPGSGEANDWTLPFFDPQAPVSVADGDGSTRVSIEPTLTSAQPERRGLQHVFRHLRLAASVLIAVSIGYFGWQKFFAADPYETQIGVISSVPLQDGSSMTMNTASKVRVDLNEHERHIELTRGEVFFEVVKDARRPFVVTVGARRIVAVGTRFSIRRNGEEIRVVVTEGRVRVQGLADNDEDLLLVAGAIANLREDGALVQHKPLPQTEEVLSWRSGYLTFRDTPLGEAIREFNQYNRQQLVVDSPAIASIALTGKFKATNFDAFVRLLEDGYRIQAQRTGDTITLSQ